jgi:hypothetical protein
MRTFLAAGLWLLAFMLSACNLSNEPQPTPIPTPNIPTVQFLFPVNESTVLEGTEIDIEIVAADTGIGISKVEFYVDDTLINERGPDISAAVPTFTVQMNWLAQGAGRHVFMAIAYRADGTQSDPTTLLVNVLTPTGQPTRAQ